MFIKSLRIESSDGLIRNLEFHQGMNLIVDETPSHNSATGNNVGKTTVLRLIDICLGKDPRSVFVSPEDNRTINEPVRNFLIEKEVVVTLTLISSWTSDARFVTVKRNFLTYSNAIREINGRTIEDKQFVRELQNVIFETETDKPSFRQLIAHNIRYTNAATTQTLRCLEGRVTDAVYETLYLYMLGCNYDNADLRQETLDSLTTETSFKYRLERKKSRNRLATELGIINSEIKELEEKKSRLHLNPDFENDMSDLTDIKFEITTLSAQLNNLKLRYSILDEAQNDLLNQKSTIDVESLKMIYAQADKFIPNLQHSFEDLLTHHNCMLARKMEFIATDMPKLDAKIKEINTQVIDLRAQEKALGDKLILSASYADYESLITDLTQRYQKKGALQEIIDQIDKVDEEIARLNTTLSDIDNSLFSDAFQKKVQEQLDKLNTYLARISLYLYGEKYGLSYDIVRNKKTGKNFYKFSITTYDSDTVNFSTGKKQGEITCFDMAYILFADKEHIPCLHFGLYDKKELMHNHQLLETANFVNQYSNLQFVASILWDKLPEELRDEKYFVVKLSPTKKLFQF